MPASNVGQVSKLRRSGLQQIGNCLQSINDEVVLLIFLLICCANSDKEQCFTTLQTCIHISHPKVQVAVDVLAVFVVHYSALSASSDY